MKLEKITETKLKIIFNSEELESNNISLHSFLSNSIESQRLFLAILDIANEDLNFDTSNCKISYEAFSFDNKTFVIFITKDENHLNSYFKDFSEMDSDGNFFHVLRDDTIFENSGFKFVDNKLLKSVLKNNLIYIFYSLEDVFDFCKFLYNSKIPETVESSLYQYNDLYILDLYTNNNLFEKDLKKLELIISEIKDTFHISEFSKTKLKEFSNLLIEKNALSILK